MLLKCFYIFIWTIAFEICLRQQRIALGDDRLSGKKYVIYFVKSEYSKPEHDSWLCGGALVSSTQILTAAACLVEMEKIYAIAGYKKYVNGMNINSDKCIKAKKQKVVRIYVPKEYNLSSQNPAEWINVDVGVAVVEKPYDFTDQTYRSLCSYEPQSVPINFEKENEAETTAAVVFGWGENKSRNPSEADINSKFLQEATTTILAKNKCANTATSAALKHIIDKYLLCTSGYIHADGHGSEPIIDFGIDCNSTSCFGDEFTFRRQFENGYGPIATYIPSNNKNIDSEVIMRRAKRSTSPGICQNDHGGPLIRSVGMQEMMIGVALNGLYNQNYECVGPFLYVSTAQSAQIIKCLLEKDPISRELCNDKIDDKRFEVKEIEIKWPDDITRHPNSQNTSSFLRNGNEKEPFYFLPSGDQDLLDTIPDQQSETETIFFQNRAVEDQLPDNTQFSAQGKPRRKEQSHDQLGSSKYEQPNPLQDKTQTTSYNQPQANPMQQKKIESYGQPQADPYNQPRIESLNQPRPELKNQPHIESFQSAAPQQSEIDSYKALPLETYKKPQIQIFNQPQKETYKQPQTETLNQPHMDTLKQSQSATHPLQMETFKQLESDPYNPLQTDTFEQPQDDLHNPSKIEAYKQSQSEILHNPHPIETYQQPQAESYNPLQIQTNKQAPESFKHPQLETYNQPQVESYKHPTESDTQLDSYKPYNYAPHIPTFSHPLLQSFKMPIVEPFKAPAILDLHKQMAFDLDDSQSFKPQPLEAYEPTHLSQLDQLPAPQIVQTFEQPNILSLQQEYEQKQQQQQPNILREQPSDPPYEPTFALAQDDPQSFDQMYSQLHGPVMEDVLEHKPTPEQTFEEMYKSLYDPAPSPNEEDSVLHVQLPEQLFGQQKQQPLEHVIQKQGQSAKQPSEQQHELRVEQALQQQFGQQFEQSPQKQYDPQFGQSPHEQLEQQFQQLPQHLIEHAPDQQFEPPQQQFEQPPHPLFEQPPHPQLEQSSQQLFEQLPRQQFEQPPQPQLEQSSQQQFEQPPHQQFEQPPHPQSDQPSQQQFEQPSQQQFEHPSQQQFEQPLQQQLGQQFEQPLPQQYGQQFEQPPPQSYGQRFEEPPSHYGQRIEESQQPYEIKLEERLEQQSDQPNEQINKQLPDQARMLSLPELDDQQDEPVRVRPQVPLDRQAESPSYNGRRYFIQA